MRHPSAIKSKQYFIVRRIKLAYFHIISRQLNDRENWMGISLYFPLGSIWFIISGSEALYGISWFSIKCWCSIDSNGEGCVCFENATPGVDVDFTRRGVFTTRRIHRRRCRLDEIIRQQNCTICVTPLLFPCQTQDCYSIRHRCRSSLISQRFFYTRSHWVFR